MKATVKHLVAVWLGAWLALYAGSATALAQLSGGSVAATAGAPSPNPSAVGQQPSPTSALNAEDTPPTVSGEGCTLNSTTWSWSLNGAPAGVYVNQYNGPSSPAADLVGAITTPGTYSMTATATATWKDSCGDEISVSGTTGTIVFTVVGVQNLQYLQPGNGYVNITGTLYVLKGQSVTFQAVPTPNGSTFPSGQPVWSGSSGASGTGQTCTVAFNTQSSSLSNYYTVTATCGYSYVTASVIVYDLTPNPIPQDNFSGRDLNTYGVCEYINLSYTTNPSGLTASEIGGLQWQITSGGGTLVDNGDGTGIYQCPEVTDNVTVGIKIAKWLAWRIFGRPIDPPNAHDCTQVPNTGLWHQQNNCGCKAQLYFWAQCANAVSFSQIEVREGKSDPAVANGLFAPVNGTVHTPSQFWFGLNALAANGYKWSNSVDTSGFAAGGAPFQAGTFQMNIYMMYRKKGDTGDGMQYGAALSKKSSDAMGLATISKASFGPVSLAAARGSNLNFGLPQPP